MAIWILGSVFFLVAAFRTSILWGLGVLFFAPIGLVFVIVHWSRAKNSFFWQLWGFAFIAIATL